MAPITGSRHSSLVLGESTGQDDAPATQQSFDTNKSSKKQSHTQCQDRHPELVTAIAGTESRDPVYEQSLDCFSVALYSVLPLPHFRENGNPQNYI